jgi:hypothetical protein
MMNWGSDLLHLIPSAEGDKVYTCESFLKTYPFFSTSLSPRSHAYLIGRIINPGNIHLLKRVSFKENFELFSRNLVAHLSQGLYVPTRVSPVNGEVYPKKPECPARKHGVLHSPGRLNQPLAAPMATRSMGEGDFPVHRLPLDRHFLDFLRLSLNISRLTEEDALTLKDSVDEQIEKGRRGLTEELWKRK